MKINNSVMGFLACALVSTSFSAGAEVLNAGLKWTGEGGYTVEGQFSYDDAFAIAEGLGAGATTGFQDLAVAFYDPGHNLLFSVVNIAGGVSSYDFLNVTFDTVTQAFTGAFDIGRESDTPGDLYLAGTIGGSSDLFNHNADSLDLITSGTTIAVIPIPATVWLFGIGLASLGAHKRLNKKAA
ncbi:MAG: hypothetical protein ACKN9T_15755 [Candidatus Methylumidiphilus sp.]